MRSFCHASPFSSNYFRSTAADLDLLTQVTVKYETFPGWQTSIENVTSFSELPENCKKYISFIEKFLNVGVEWIGVGPGRSAMIQKK